MHLVIRNLPLSYIFFDLFFLGIFLFYLVRFRQKLALHAFFVGGILIMLIDWGWWLNVRGVRTLELANSFLPGWNEKVRVFIFMFWFSMTYGVMFSWMYLMMQKKSNKVGWTLFVFFWWVAAGLLAQAYNPTEEFCRPIRKMNSVRIFQVGVGLIGYIVLFIMKYRPLKICYLFMIGCTIHFMMESALFITKVRPWNENSVALMIFNTIVETNQGIPIIFLVYDLFLKKIYFPKEKN